MTSESHSQNRIHAPVFYTSLAIIVGFFALTLANLERAQEVFGGAQAFFTGSFGWFLVMTVNILFVFCGYLVFSRFGGIRIGGASARPQFSSLTWFSMLFSAGMGIGLLFFGVSEPITHFANPPLPPPAHLTSPAAIAGEAMSVTFLHWGLHAWATYAVIGLALAYVKYNRGLPLTVSAILTPILPRRMPWLAHTVDILAIVATVCGVSTSLGLGASQVNAGLTRLFDLPETPMTLLIIVAVITVIATMSVASGLEKGIRRLSEINMSLAGVLLLFVLLAGPTVFILDGFVQNVGHYLQNFVRLSTWSEAYVQTDWQNGWTVFYWAWWISWSPFVGMFIARISYGRTVREFVLGVLFVPTLLTFFWMSVFGNSALHIELFGAGGLAEAVNASAAHAMFVFLGHFPLAEVTSFLAIIIVVTFFVTSADSGAMVTDIIASGGEQNRGVLQRSVWAVALGLMAGVLLMAGGLGALQTAAIVTGLPFALVLLLMCFAVHKLMSEDYPYVVEHEDPANET
jgi:choline/glycine/proline betaine transport protein